LESVSASDISVEIADSSSSVVPSVVSPSPASANIYILQSDNGRECTANIITDLRSLWQELVIVHGRPRHPQSQGSVERANADIKEMIISWIRRLYATSAAFLDFRVLKTLNFVK
jgi:hypothetical protein